MLHSSLLSFISVVAILPALTSAACSVFTPHVHNTSGDITYTATLSNHRVSAVVNCSGSELGTQAPPNPGVVGTSTRCNSTQCALAIPHNFLVRVNSFLNVSLQSPEADQELLTLVRDTLQQSDRPYYDFNQTVVGPVSQVSTCLNEGQAGNWNFAPTYICTEGTLSECEDTDEQNAPQNGWNIRACGLSLLSGQRLLDGTLNIVSLYGFNSQPAPANATPVDNSDTSENGASSMVISASYSGMLWALFSTAMLTGLWL